MVADAVPQWNQSCPRTRRTTRYRILRACSKVCALKLPTPSETCACDVRSCHLFHATVRLDRAYPDMLIPVSVIVTSPQPRLCCSDHPLATILYGSMARTASRAVTASRAIQDGIKGCCCASSLRALSSPNSPTRSPNSRPCEAQVNAVHGLLKCRRARTFLRIGTYVNTFISK